MFFVFIEIICIILLSNRCDENFNTFLVPLIKWFFNKNYCLCEAFENLYKYQRAESTKNSSIKTNNRSLSTYFK